MKGKIIALSLAFAFGAAAIAFSIRPAGIPSGKGGGKSSSVEKPQEFVKIVSSLPSGNDYYQLALQAKENNKAKSGIAAELVITDKNFRPVTLSDKSTVKSEVTNSYEYRVRLNPDRDYETKIYSTDKKIKSSIVRDVVAHYAEDGVYYDVKATVSDVNSDYICYYEDYGSYKDGYNAETIVTNTVELDGALYVGVKGVYFKYNQFDITSTTEKYEMNKLIEDSTEDVEVDAVGEMALKAIRDHYGKWIDATYDYEFNEDDMGSGDIDSIIKWACAVISDMVVEKFVESVDAVSQYNARITKASALADSSSNDYFKKDGDFYIMTPRGRYELLEDFGYVPSESSLSSAIGSGGKIDYEKLYAVSSSNYVLDLTYRQKPAWYLHFSFNSDNELSKNNKRRISLSINQELNVTNIDNVELPKINATKNVYEFIGEDLKRYVTEKGLIKEGK